MLQQITSIKDPRVVEARELNSAAGRARMHKCLLEGSESIRWAIEAGLPVEYVFFSPGQEKDPFFRNLQEQQTPCYLVSEGILKKISDTSYLVPYIGVAGIPTELSEMDPMGNFVVVLDHIQDHGNIGTIIRTASAFGIRDIISTTPQMDVYYKKIVTASRGRVFDTRIRRCTTGTQALNELKQRGYQVVATSPYAKDIQSLAPLQPKPIALVVGNETTGISEEILRNADIVVQIPMSGMVESLNVGVATGISLYELKFRMVLTMLTNHIQTNFGREVNITGKLILQAFDTQLRQVTDLSSTQVILLMILKCDQLMTLEQISRDTATFGDELNSLLKPLLERGYIRQPPDDHSTFVLTEEGERVLAQLWNTVERSEREVLTGFSEQERKQFNDYLKRIQANCIRIIEHS